MDKRDTAVLLEADSASSKSKNKKRKWREIEAIKDRFKLRKELQDIDIFGELELVELEF